MQHIISREYVIYEHIAYEKNHKLKHIRVHFNIIFYLNVKGNHRVEKVLKTLKNTPNGREKMCLCRNKGGGAMRYVERSRKLHNAIKAQESLDKVRAFPFAM